MFPVAIELFNIILVLVAFRDSLYGVKLEFVPGEDTQGRNGRAVDEAREIFQLKAVWLLNMFFFFYLGAAITAGGESSSRTVRAVFCLYIKS